MKFSRANDKGQLFLSRTKRFTIIRKKCVHGPSQVNKSGKGQNKIIQVHTSDNCNMHTSSAQASK